MKTAEELRQITNNVRGNTPGGLKLLPVNANKKYYIPLPYKLKMIELLINDAAESGNNFKKIHNGITEEAEETLIKKGFKVKYFKNYIKISW